MIIQRNLNDCDRAGDDGSIVLIQLNPEELRDAYLEHQHQQDKEAILQWINAVSDAQIAEAYSLTREEALSLVDAVAAMKRAQVDEGVPEDVAEDTAFLKVSQEFIDNGRQLADDPSQDEPER